MPGRRRFSGTALPLLRSTDLYSGSRRSAEPNRSFVHAIVDRLYASGLVVPLILTFRNVNVNEPQTFDVKEIYIRWIVRFPCAISLTPSCRLRRSRLLSGGAPLISDLVENVLLPDINARASVTSLGQADAPTSSVGRIEALRVKIVAAEVFAVAIASLLTSLAYFGVVKAEWPPAFEYFVSIFLIPLLVLVAAGGFKQYAAIQAQSRDRYMLGGIGAVTLAFALLVTLLFVMKVGDWYSRGTFFCQFIGVSFAILIVRGWVHGYIRHALQSGAIEARRAVLVGDAKANVEVLTDLHQSGVRLAGVLEMPHVDHTLSPAGEFSSQKRTFVERCRAFKPDDVILLVGQRDLPLVFPLVGFLSELPVTVNVVPIGLRELTGPATIINFGRTLAVQVQHPPLSWFDRVLKRGFDICVAGFGLLIFSPLLVMISLAIKLDSRGSVIFRQNRHGYDNEIISVMKFRTMNIVEDGATPATFTQAKANDERITPLGRILRRTNLDELPQLFNVLRGEMSIVGPRPHPIALNKMFEERIAPFSRRHNVKPGLTGWAQVNGLRGETDTQEKMCRRIEYDLYYIDHWSFIFDLKIVVMTVFSRSAYMNAN
jgi:Undecaprenyl-phosphate glucose phosphotransferase